MELITFEDSGKLLRLADSLETNAIMGWLSASGTVPKNKISFDECINNIKKNYKSILTEYPTFRIKIQEIDNLQYWCYAKNEEIQFDNLIKINKDNKIEDEVPPIFDPTIAPLWRLYLSEINEVIKIKIIASHGIIDGRTLFDLFDLFTSYALNKELNEKLKNAKNQPVLYEYGKKDWFTKEITDKKLGNPFININIKNNEINPHVPLPSYVINPQWDVDYLPISKFCRKYNITPQSILMAIQNEAIRIYNEGKIDDIPISIYIPIDNRNSKFASELFKKSLFFSHVGFIMPFLNNEKNILENMKNCYNILEENLFTSKSCDIAYFSANMRNYETKELSYPKNFPEPSKYIFASHLGLVGVGFNNVQFRSYSPVYENMYWPNLYGFHNKNIFSFMFNCPYNCPKKFIDSVKDTSLKYYNFIINEIKE